jgi:hypothetical protein
VLGDWEGFDGDKDAATTILDLARNPEQLSRMSAAAFTVCDGEGAPRVAEHIAAFDLANV